MADPDLQGGGGGGGPPVGSKNRKGTAPRAPPLSLPPTCLDLKSLPHKPAPVLKALKELERGYKCISKRTIVWLQDNGRAY